MTVAGSSQSKTVQPSDSSGVILDVLLAVLLADHQNMYSSKYLPILQLHDKTMQTGILELDLFRSEQIYTVDSIPAQPLAQWPPDVAWQQLSASSAVAAVCLS